MNCPPGKQTQRLFDAYAAFIRLVSCCKVRFIAKMLRAPHPITPMSNHICNRELLTRLSSQIDVNILHLNFFLLLLSPFRSGLTACLWIFPLAFLPQCEHGLFPWFAFVGFLALRFITSMMTCSSSNASNEGTKTNWFSMQWAGPGLCDPMLPARARD